MQQARKCLGWLFRIPERIGGLGLKVVGTVIRTVVRLLRWVIRLPLRIPSVVPRTVIGLAILALLVLGAVALWRSDLTLIVRDAGIALYAHAQAGDPIPLDDTMDYTRSLVVSVNEQWGMETNSRWLGDEVRYIVPYFALEGLRLTPVYPRAVYFAPYPGEKAFRVGGQAHPNEMRITLTERYIAVPQDEADQRSILATLTHELVHLQGGNFLEFPPHIAANDWAAWSQWIESHTEAATTEILAAMCLYRHSVACEAFWQQIETFARQSLSARLGQYHVLGFDCGNLYNLFANIFLRDADQREQAWKSTQYWKDRQAERLDVITKYGQFPWEQYVIPGIIRGRSLDTGIQSLVDQTYYVEMYRASRLQFDDTQHLIPWIGRLWLWLGQ